MKHAFWAVLAVLGLMLAAAAFLAHAPGAAREAQASVVSFTPLAAGTSHAPLGRVDYRITTASDLAKLWQMLGSTSTPPVVDFSSEEVLAVLASASEVKVASIEDAATRTVTVEVCSAASSTSYELVAVPTSALPLTHRDAAAGC